MKLFDWDNRKNQMLLEDRNISFEEIVFSIDKGFLLDVIRHPNIEKYGHQRMLVVAVRGYAYLVPFVENEEVVFLKTIIPSRKATQKYLA